MTATAFGPYVLRAVVLETPRAVFQVGERPDGQLPGLLLVKRYRAGAPGLLDELRRRSAAMLQSPGSHVVPALDIVDVGGVPAVVRPLLRAFPLADIVARAARARRAVPPGVAVRLVHDVLAALESLHAAGPLVHGEVTADHVLVDDTGRVVLVGAEVPRAQAGRQPQPRHDLSGALALMYDLLPSRKATGETPAAPGLPPRLSALLTEAMGVRAGVADGPAAVRSELVSRARAEGITMVSTDDLGQWVRRVTEGAAPPAWPADAGTQPLPGPAATTPPPAPAPRAAPMSPVAPVMMPLAAPVSAPLGGLFSAPRPISGLMQAPQLQRPAPTPQPIPAVSVSPVVPPPVTDPGLLPVEPAAGTHPVPSVGPLAPPPVVVMAPPQVVIPAPQPPMHEVPVLLLAEPENELAETLLARFAAENIQVIRVSDGREAKAQLDGARPDIIVAELALPKVDGFSLLLAARAREHTREVPFFMLSGRADDAQSAKALELGADDYLSKPLNVDVLVGKVRRSAARFRDMLQSRAQAEEARQRALEMVAAAEAPRAAVAPPAPVAAQPVDDAPEPRAEPTGVIGTLKQMSVVEIVQSLEMGRKTAVVSLMFPSRGEGQLWVVEGDVVHAELVEKVEEEAFYEMARFKEGFFRIHYGDPPDREPRIRVSTTFMILEAMRRVDEENA